MKRRHRYLLNLLSLSLLAFALYLNFVKEEGADASLPNAKEALPGKQKSTTTISAGHTAQTFMLK